MKQLNIRIPDELDDALQAFIKASGEKQSTIVRRGIQLAIQGDALPALMEEMDGIRVERAKNEELLAVGQQAEAEETHPSEPSSAAESPAAAPPDPGPVLDAAPPEDREGGDTGSSSTVDFVAWLAERAAIPRAVARRRISEGRVVVDGRPRHCDAIDPEELLHGVALDGNPV